MSEQVGEPVFQLAGVLGESPVLLAEVAFSARAERWLIVVADRAGLVVALAAAWSTAA